MAQRGHQKYRGKGKKDHGHKRVHKFDADRFVSDMEAAVSGKISANRTFITLYIKKITTGYFLFNQDRKTLTILYYTNIGVNLKTKFC